MSDETRLENGKVVVDLYYEVLCPDSRSFVLHQLYPAWQGLKDIFTINYIPYGKALVRRLDKFELYRIQFNQFKEFNGPQKTIPTNCWQNSNPFSYKEHFLTQILAELEHFHWQPSWIPSMWPHELAHWHAWHRVSLLVLFSFWFFPFSPRYIDENPELLSSSIIIY